jgi:hypothetical protein
MSLSLESDRVHPEQDAYKYHIYSQSFLLIELYLYHFITEELPSVLYQYNL